ncbi:MAG: glycerophosphodiester phosphodiesterase family protein, partial [Allomuricauda sp.]
MMETEIHLLKKLSTLFICKTAKSFLFIACTVNIVGCGPEHRSTSKLTTLEDRIDILKSPKESYIMVAAHRGDWRNYPENSLPAIQSAINMGVDIIEIDVQRTIDGEFILMHDQTLDRTTNTTGKVSEKTLNDLSKVTLRHAHGGYSEDKIPTLREALLLVKGKVFIDLDKAYPYIDEIVPLLKETGTFEQALFVGPGNYEDLEYPLLQNPEHILYTPIFSDKSKGYASRIDALEKSNADPNIYE